MRTFIDRFESLGDAPALILPDRRAVSYADLARRIAETAQRLEGPKGLAALEAATSEHFIVTYLAALQAGHAVALLPPDDAAAFSAFEADFAPEFAYRLTGGRWHLHADHAPRAASRPAAPHPDLALMLGTSGSTGRRKYVRLSFDAIESNAAAIGTYLGLQQADRGALLLPLHYSYGLSVLHAHLAAGAAVVLPGKAIRDPGFLDVIRDTGCTNLAGVPYSFELFESIGLRDSALPALRFMTAAGGRLAPDLVNRYHNHLAATDGRFFVMYGQTEAAPRIAYVPPEQLSAHPDCIGIAVPGGRLALVADDGSTVDMPDTPGELVYSGPNVMMGYAEVRADLARGHEVATLHTRDLAVRNADGLYRIVGRMKRMSKIAGLRIGHEALEHALSAAGISAAVTGNDRHILAACTGKPDEDAVRAILVRETGLPAPHILVRTMPSLPRLATGKVDYEALRRLMAEDADTAESRNGSILEAFRQAFYPRTVGPQDSFAALGGDSLLFVQISMALERRLGHVPDGWEHRSVADLAGLRHKRSAIPLMDTALIVRALAILLIVVAHATPWPIPGGAAALVILVGHGLARFQSDALMAGDFKRVLRPVGVNLIPYYIIAAAYCVAWGTLLWPSLLLIGNFGFADPSEHTMLPFLYWFVEAYVQIMLIWLGLFAIPAVRRFVRDNPFAFGLAMIVAAMALRFSLPYLWSIGGRQIFTIPWILYLAAFGWCIHYARNHRQKLATALAALIVFPAVAYDGGNWTGSWVKYMMQLGIVLLLLYAPRIPVPRAAAALLLPVAAASYHIYLVHRFPPELMFDHLEDAMTPGVFSAVSIVTGVALGLAVHQLQRFALHRLSTPARGRLAVERA